LRNISRLSRNISFYHHDEDIGEVPRESRQLADDEDENAKREVVLY
jgi:hypothetical protein